MEVRKTSGIAFAALFVAALCFSTTASARHGEITRNVLLAPLVIPAAIAAATLSPPVVYRETRYVEEPRYYYRDDHRYRPAPRYNDRRHYRNDSRRYDNRRYDGRYYRR